MTASELGTVEDVMGSDGVVFKARVLRGHFDCDNCRQRIETKSVLDIELLALIGPGGVSAALSKDEKRMRASHRKACVAV